MKVTEIAFARYAVADMKRARKKLLRVLANDIFTA
jgi:hypothetical protein